MSVKIPGMSLKKSLEESKFGSQNINVFREMSMWLKKSLAIIANVAMKSLRVTGEIPGDMKP